MRRLWKWFGGFLVLACGCAHAVDSTPPEYCDPPGAVEWKSAVAIPDLYSHYPATGTRLVLDMADGTDWTRFETGWSMRYTPAAGAIDTVWCEVADTGVKIVDTQGPETAQ